MVKRGLKISFYYSVLLVFIGKFFILVFFSCEEEHWKRPTPIPDSLDNIYNWPPKVKYLGTPIPEINNGSV
ncbi:MAG: hypothetical protein Ct9H90mP2_13660 [Dehalococcoidia bacterium]|nr:MAG: hypothetical protein Ct9H90mP2_13660 [Dehalococcoidia bacterium]